VADPVDILPLIRTKLYPPSVPEDCVPRPRLMSALDQALRVPLTVVSAPAGYGKSVMVSDWISRLDTPSAWVSLDDTESDLRQFLTCVIQAIESFAPDALAAVRELLPAVELPPLQMLFGYLINDLDHIDEPFVLVLDDFHRLNSQSPVGDLLTLLLDRPPPGMHLLIVTRRDLSIPLGRLRASNQLVEIRMRDLRFTPEEASALIFSAAHKALSDSALRHLEAEIEGWPVGLRLVALMVRQTSDPDATVQGLHGGIPQTQEYMLQEVLAGLSPEVKECLLRTSILSRFSARLIDAVCWSRDLPSKGLDGQSFIEELEQSNLFAQSLDSQGRWYRYHHWFQGMLERQLQAEFGEHKLIELHQRAAAWFEANDEPGEAQAHLLAAGQPGAAADLVARKFLGVIEADRWFVVERWLNLLPVDVRNERSDMQIAGAWVGFCKLDIELVIAHLTSIDVLLHDSAAQLGYEAQLDFLNGWVAYWQGDLEIAQRYLGRAMGGFDVAPGMIAGELRLYVAFAMSLGGDHSGSVRFIAEQRVAAGVKSGVPYMIRILGAGAHTNYIAGDIDAAAAAADSVKALGDYHENGYALGWVAYLKGVQHFSRCELPAALQQFALGDAHLNMLERRAAVDMLATIALAQWLSGHRDAATAAHVALEQFVRNYEVDDCVWIIESVAARLALLAGDTAAALNWARTVILPEVSPVETHLWVANPAITRARVLILAGDQPDVEQGLKSLDQLLEQYRAYHNVCQIIDILPLRAVALARLGDQEQALTVLLQAVQEAAPGRWIRPFVELGEPVRELLAQLDPAEGERHFVQCALDMLATSAAVLVANGQQLAPGFSDAAEGLTNRELDILELLEQRLQNKEIAARLHISPHTVGYHLKHIYQKLDVNGRRQAVQKARATGILAARPSA